MPRDAVLLTGISGNLGRALTKLLHRDHRVVGIDRRPFIGRPKDIEVHQLDIRKKKIEDVFRRGEIKALIHMGIMHDPRLPPSEHHSFNVLGTRAMSNRKRIWIIILLLGVAALTVLLPVIVFGHRGHPPPPPEYVCEAQLKSIHGAKATWALDERKGPEDVPTDADLFGVGRLLAEKPVCPAGGSYILGKVAEKPRCTVPGHAL